jgi:hypothetical protein
VLLEGLKFLCAEPVKLSAFSFLRGHGFSDDRGALCRVGVRLKAKYG